MLLFPLFIAYSLFSLSMVVLNVSSFLSPSSNTIGITVSFLKSSVSILFLVSITGIIISLYFCSISLYVSVNCKFGFCSTSFFRSSCKDFSFSNTSWLDITVGFSKTEFIGFISSALGLLYIFCPTLSVLLIEYVFLANSSAFSILNAVFDASFISCVFSLSDINPAFNKVSFTA